MNPVPELAPHLKQLRLSGILDSLEARNRQAIDSKLAYTEFLATADCRRGRPPRAQEVRAAATPRGLPRHQNTRSVRLRAAAATEPRARARACHRPLSH